MSDTGEHPARPDYHHLTKLYLDRFGDEFDVGEKHLSHENARAIAGGDTLLTAFIYLKAQYIRQAHLDMEMIGRARDAMIERGELVLDAAGVYRPVPRRDDIEG